MTNIVWAFDRNYLECGKVSFFSYVLNMLRFSEDANSDIESNRLIFIIDGDFEDDISLFISRIEGHFGIKFDFDIINASDEVKSLNYDKRVGVGSVLRMMMPEVASGKTLYLDSDTMFVDDARPLLNFDFDGWPMAAKRDLDAAWYYSDKSFSSIGFYCRKDMLSYFNSGVMLFDFDNEVCKKKFEEAKELLKTHAFKHGDQDALNTTFRNSCKMLPTKFNTFAESDEAFWGFTDWPVLVHFTMDRNKPWLHEDCKHKWCNRWKRQHKFIVKNFS